MFDSSTVYYLLYDTFKIWVNLWAYKTASHVKLKPNQTRIFKKPLYIALIQKF